MRVEDLGFGIRILCRLYTLAPGVNCILLHFDQFLWRFFSYVSFWIFWYQHALANRQMQDKPGSLEFCIVYSCKMPCWIILVQL